MLHQNARCSPLPRRAAVAVRAVASQEVKTVTLQAQRITPEAFAPFGQVRGRSGAPQRALRCAADHAFHRFVSVKVHAAAG